ncbi:MAG TPA: hypothetical protein VGY55_04250, partial [Pirellulales bacterium]|nr:hypothetical protein [Pirellulales bacterium]
CSISLTKRKLSLTSPKSLLNNSADQFTPASFTTIHSKKPAVNNMGKGKRKAVGMAPASR